MCIRDSNITPELVECMLFQDSKVLEGIRQYMLEILTIWIIKKGDLMIREKANSSYLEAICSKASVFPLLRYEVINDFVAEEPVQIAVQERKDGVKETLEQIFFFKICHRNRVISYSIYAAERELKFEGNTYNKLMIRKVLWDKAKDKQIINPILQDKNISSDKKRKLISPFPSILTDNVLLDTTNKQRVLRHMQKLDSIINHGICLKDVKEDDYSADDWTELTVKRLFDWGLIQAVWDYGKSCIAVEEIILSMEKYFDESMVCLLYTSRCV